MEVCFPDVPGDLLVKNILLFSSGSLFSHSHHLAYSFFLHVCLLFLVNEILSFFALILVRRVCWEVAKSCTPCCDGPHQCLLLNVTSELCLPLIYCLFTPGRQSVPPLGPQLYYTARLPGPNV